MKIKHWAGYGCVNARKVKDGSCKLHIRIEGNHEQGLDRYDEYDLFNWLVIRFDKTVQDYLTWHRSRPIIEIRPGWRSDPVLGCIDICDYYFTY